MKSPTPARDHLFLFLLVVLIVGVPTVFLRNTFTTFDVPQITLLWIAATGVVLAAIYRAVVSGKFEKPPRLVVIAVAAFVLALVVTTVLSHQPWVAFTGLGVRGAGSLTYGLCVGLMYAVYAYFRYRSAAPLILAFCAAHCVVVGYTLLQAYGLDPFTWGFGNIYVGPVFSTLGNPNFSAAYVGLTLPLLAWIPFGSAYRSTTRVVVAAVVGASSIAVAHLNSFQGGVVALAGISVVWHWVWTRKPAGRPVAALISLPAVVVIAGVSLLSEAPGFSLLLVSVLVSGSTGLIGVWWDRRYPVEVVSGLGSAYGGWTRKTAILVVTLAAGAVAVFGPRTLAELGSGLEHRVAFWKTGLSIFRANPLVGTGLETYPAYFTAHRPLDYAVSWDTVLSDSAHSVPLGFLAGGGLLLTVTYLAVVGLIGFFGLKSIRNSNGPSRLFKGAIFSAWAAYHLQSLVSIDMPGLIHTQWILGGVLLAGSIGTEGELVLPWGRRRARRYRQDEAFQGVQRWVAAMVLVLTFVVCLGPLSRPLRADLAAHRASQAMSVADLQTAGDALLEAIELQSRNSFYADGMAVVYEESGLPELALRERERSAILQPGVPYAAMNAAWVAAGLNRFEAAGAWAERAVLDDPYGPLVLTGSAELFTRIGDPRRALVSLKRFRQLGFSGHVLSGPWRSAQRTYLQLSEQARAEGDMSGAVEHSQAAAWASKCWGESGVEIPVDCGMKPG